MNEARRIAYLQAMGIDTFVSRQDLPAAAPSRRLRIVRRAPLPGSKHVSAEQGAARPTAARPTAARPTAEILDQVSGTAVRSAAVETANTAAPPPAAADSATGDLPIFSVVTSLAGGWLWLDEIPARRDPGPAYGQLLQAICHALGLPDSPIDVAGFNFPNLEGAQLGRDLDAARGALLGYLNRRLDLANPRGVVLLGPLEQAWFDRSCLEGRTCVNTVSAWKMLREPALKARAWADLQVLRGDGG